MADKFVVIDGSSLMYRAFYALPLLTTSDGVYTNAVHGFAKMFVKIMTDLKPDTVVIAFDKGKKTFRNELFAEYKGTRKKTPEELVEQIPLIHRLAEVMGVTLIEEAGFEADDIIGTLSVKAAAAGNDVMVVTGDRDALQLVRDNLRVMLTKKGISEMEVFDEAAFKEKYGLAPLQLIDLKGLMGDSSDNIPGVPGVGEKTATKLLLQYESVENVLEHIDEISGKKLQEKLRDNRELAILSKKLATIICDMDVEYDAENYKLKNNSDQLKDFCKRYELKSILAQVDGLFAEKDEFGFGTVENVIPDAEVIASEEALAEVLTAVRKAGRLVFYACTSGHIPQLAVNELFIINSGTVYAVPEFLAQGRLIKEVMADSAVMKITHDMKLIYELGMEIKGEIFDTMLAAYLLEPTSNDYTIKALLENYQYSGHQPENFSSASEHAVWAVLGIEEVYPTLRQKMQEMGVEQLYQDIELPLLPVLAAMERAGITVNKQSLTEMSVEIGKKIDELLEEIHALAGTEFNVNSPKQLGEVLFERLELPVIKKTKTGYSTNADVLEQLLFAHPIIEKILEYRSWTKLKSTYLDGLVILIDEATGRIYAKFNQMVTATGRLSSSEPNLQNIPVRTEAGKRIRELFVPGEGYDCLLSADYSQIELRLLAHMSRDKNFVEAFTHGEDVHARTASEVFGVPLSEVTSTLRSRAKAVNFGIVYGISDYGLSKDLHVSRREAAEYIKNYFEKCPGVKSFIDKTVEAAHRDGFVTTLFDRRRYLPDINSKNFNLRSFAERTAMNTPIQGTAADIIKKAMIDVYNSLQEQQLKSRILVQVHDELLLEVVESEIEAVKAILKETMENTVQLSVPLTIDMHMGRNWAEAK